MSISLQTGARPDSAVFHQHCLEPGLKTLLQAVIHLLTQFFAGLEVRNILGRQLHRFTSFRITPGSGCPVVQGKAAKSPDFNTLTIGKGLRHMLDDGLNR
jgi:hypothetical protein